MGRATIAQDVWDLAIEDLPPLDFPDASAGESGSVPPYRLPLPEGNGGSTQSDPQTSEKSASGEPRDTEKGGAGSTASSTASSSDGDDSGEWLLEESMYNEPEDYQLRDFLAPVFSSSDWYRNGHWYVDTTAAGIWRSSGKPKVLAKDLSGLETGILTPTPIISTPVNQITTRHKGFRFEPGLGLTVGRFLGRDYFNRDASVEFGFLGLFDWDTDLTLAGALSSELFTALNKTGPGGSAVGPIISGGQSVPLGVTLIPGFDAVDIQQFEYSSDFDSFELNVRLSHRPGRDRMVAMPDGTWTRQITDGGVPSFFAGMRYISVEERLLWLSQGAATQSLGRYDVQTNNALFGLQFGGDYKWVTKTWSAGAMGKVGAYVNFADMRRQISGSAVDGGIANMPRSIYEEVFGVGTNPYVFADNLPNRQGGSGPGAGAVSWSYSGAQRTSVYSVFLETKMFTQYNVNPNLSFRMAWDMFWINGLAMAPYQVVFEPESAKINAGGNVFFTGLSVSGQWVW
ncbi:MAG: hypothetical protein VX431_01335 [Planctomycetota bacterium]|nr:hypothetical protein [Planctomycetota bacterium]